jgi:hypothetical protein
VVGRGSYLGKKFETIHYYYIDSYKRHNHKTALQMEGGLSIDILFTPASPAETYPLPTRTLPVDNAGGIEVKV